MHSASDKSFSHEENLIGRSQQKSFRNHMAFQHTMEGAESHLAFDDKSTIQTDDESDKVPGLGSHQSAIFARFE
jgi:hypothetical protein